jgi:exopolyphosphatase/guanosine-5'-triphosphate,3'-diphosphate pyrophosphatase
MSERVAVIDVGSNSVLLLVAEFIDGYAQPVAEDYEVTGLGEGTKATGYLRPEAMQRTAEALQSAWQQAASQGASKIEAKGTMALRIAQNANEFLELAENQGTPVSVLSGEEEAQNSFLSVACHPLYRDFPLLSVIDVGGHSTEIQIGERAEDGTWKTRFQESRPMGTLTLKGGTLSDECPGFRERLRAVGEIDDALGFIVTPGVHSTAVAVGASATNLVTIRDRIEPWDPSKVEGATLDYEEVSKAAAWLSELPLCVRASLPGIETGREGTVHIGALILERALHCLKVLECRVSTRGWRFGLAEQLLNKRLN